MDPTVETPLDTSRTFRRRTRFAVALVTAVGVGLYGLWVTRQAVLLLFLGVAMGSLLYYSSQWLAGRVGGPRGAWVGLILVTVLGGMAAAVVLGAPRLLGESEALIREAPTVLAALEARLSLPEGMLSLPAASSALAARALGVFNTLAGALAGTLVVVVVAAFVAVSPRQYVDAAARLVDRDRQGLVREMLHEISRVLLGWTRGVGIGVGLLTAIGLVGLTAIDVPGAVPLALFAGALTAIPTFGPFIGWAPAVGVAFATGTTTGLWTLGLAVVAQQIEGNLVTPKVQGALVSVAPAFILAVQILLGALAGFLGVLMAVPVAGTALVLIRHLYIGPFVRGEGVEPDAEPGTADASEAETPSPAPPEASGA